MIGWILVALIFVYPVWRIFARAGLAPALSLILFVPGLGPLIVLGLLAFLRWPALEPGGGPDPAPGT